MLKKWICLLVALGLCALPVRAASQEILVTTHHTAKGSAVVMTAAAAQNISVNAQAAIVIEAKTGRVLFAQNAEARLPFASTTKIMTALIALEQPGIDEPFVVDTAAIQVEGSSMGLQEGDQATLRTLAAGMLLPSGNDAANAAAVHISGSIDAFVVAMNRRAADLGLENTSFETPSGLDGEMHYTTAHDLALIAREALGNDDFTAICSQYKMKVQYGNPPYDRWLTNHNRLLRFYEGATGMKTGFTKKAGRCLVSTASRDGVDLICVTLDCPDDWNTHQMLLDHFFGTLRGEDLALGAPQVSLPVTGGTSGAVPLRLEGNAPFAVPVEGADVQYTVRAHQFLYAPVQEGTQVGWVDIRLDGELVESLPLLTGGRIDLLHPYEEKQSVGQRIADFFSGLLPG